jgi:hypothetical protein
MFEFIDANYSSKYGSNTIYVNQHKYCATVLAQN